MAIKRVIGIYPAFSIAHRQKQHCPLCGDAVFLFTSASRNLCHCSHISCTGVSLFPSCACFNPLAVTLTEQDILTSCYGTPRLFCMRSWIALLSVGGYCFLLRPPLLLKIVRFIPPPAEAGESSCYVLKRASVLKKQEKMILFAFFPLPQT